MDHTHALLCSPFQTQDHTKNSLFFQLVFQCSAFWLWSLFGIQSTQQVAQTRSLKLCVEIIVNFCHQFVFLLRYNPLMMKTLILIFFLLTTFLSADTEEEHTIPPYDLSLSQIQTIDADAIVYGDGEKTIYAFIDPLCPYSRKFISLVAKNPKMISKYQYHLFLYSVPRLKSTDAVSAIYTSKNPIQTLLKTMVDEDVTYDEGNETTKARVGRIEKVGKTLNIMKRPYIFIIN